MTLYGVTVLLIVFGLLLLALDVLLLITTRSLLLCFARMAPASRTNAILLARFIPVGAALLLTASVFLPAWLRHEPLNTGEAVSAPLLTMALLAILPILQGFYRATRMFLKTRDRLLLWQRGARHISLFQSRFEVVEIKSEALTLCVGGYLKPTIYASAHVVEALEQEELNAALAHEVAHASTRDPLRILWMGSCPDFLQFFGLDETWRRAFTSACEFAADTRACRSNPEVALDLASALVKVARLGSLGSRSAGAMIDVAVSAAFSNRDDLEARVQALANPSGDPLEVGAPLRPWTVAAFVLFLCATGMVASEQVHAITEELGRLLASI